jgi:hypothetical protein
MDKQGKILVRRSAKNAAAWLRRAAEHGCPATPKRRRVDLPLIKSWRGKKLDLTHFDFDELLG